MIPITRSPGAFSTTTTASGTERLGASLRTETDGNVVYLVAAAPAHIAAPPPDDCVDIDAYVADLKTAHGEAAFAEASTWVADTFYPGEQSLRTLRLRAGLSQAELAARIGTRQPHIARLERGVDNMHLDTCRRLCAALQVDMNTLDRALQVPPPDGAPA